MAHKLSILLALLISTGGAQATVREGFYIGAGGGATINQFSFQALNIDTDRKITKTAETTNGIGTAFIGYGFTTCSCFYLGAEVGTRFPKTFAKLNRPGVTLSDFTFTNRLSVRECFSVDLLPGYRVCPDFLLYGRIGVSYAHLALTLDENRLANVDRYHFTDNRYGFRAGAGINYAFTRCIGIGLDYCYSGYSQQKTFIELFRAEQNHRPHSHYIGLSLILNFP